MFWNDERIKWYLVAAEYTKYHDKMSNVVKSIIPKGESLVDYGCGLGVLSRKLSNHCSEIYGVDYDKRVLEMLDEEIKKSYIKNYHTILSDCYDDKLVYLKNKDNILFSHFGKIDEIFDNCKDSFVKRMIIIRNESEKEVVHYSKKNTIGDICKFFDNKGIKYELYRQTFEFGQPLKDDEEVIEYLAKWYGEEGINLLSNVIDIDYTYKKEKFTKYYCKPKNTAIVVVKKEELYEKN